MPYRFYIFIRRLGAAVVLTVVPSLPGLLAFPLLAAASRPAFGQAASAAPAPAADVAAPAEDRVAAALAKLPPPAPGETWVEVSIPEQLVRIYHERNVVREMIASTGVDTDPTPVGSFRLQNRGEWFFSEKYQQGGWYWVSFRDYGTYLFHSVPTDRQKRLIPEEAELLGVRASHGCVRLALEDARWFYEHLPAGTRVEIHE